MATSAPASGVLPPGGSPPGVVEASPPVTAGGGALDPGADPAPLEGAGGGGDVVPPLPGGGGPLAQQQQDSEDIPHKRKATSFKITNVFLSRPPSNDGEDSCEDGEDLEDSHTEDLSDITDLNSLNNLSSQLEFVVGLTGTVNGGLGVAAAPVEGTQAPGAVQGKPPAAPGKQPAANQSSKEAGGGQAVTRKSSNGAADRRPSADKQVWEAFSHPGFGFVTYQQAGGATFPVSYVDNTTGYLPVAGTMAVINNVEKGGVSEVPVSSQTQHGPQDFRNRFRIVKVETTEPLKRGRWTCLDFVDKPAAKEKEVLPAGPGTTGPSKPVAGPTTAQGTKNPTVSRPASEVIKDGLASSRRISDLVTSGLVNAATVSQGMTMGVQLQGGTQSSTVPPQGATLRSEAGLSQRPPETQQRLPGVPSDSVEPRRLPGQTETSPAPVSSLSSGSVSEDRELEGVGKSQNNGRVTGSVPPDGLRGQHVSFPSQSSYPPTSSAPPPHSISLPGPPASLAGAQSAVQSPHTVGRPEFPQATLGQIVRMHDGQLAQVALAPFPGGPQQQAGGQQQPTVVLKPLPASTSHNLSPGQQQVVVQNKQGQQFLVQQPTTNNPVPPASRPSASQPGPQPAAAAVQPVKKVSQQQQASVSQQQQPSVSQQQQPPASQQQPPPASQPQQQPAPQPTVTQSQQKPFSPGAQTTSGASTAMQPTPQQAPVAPTSLPSTPLPAQPAAASQQPPVVGPQQGDRGAGGVVSQPSGGQSSQTQQNQNTSQATTPASLSTAVPTIQWTAGQQSVSNRTNTNTQPHIVTVASQGQCGTVVSSVGGSSVAQSPVSVAGQQVSSGAVVLGVTQGSVMATGISQTSASPVCQPSSTATATQPYHTVGYVAGGLVTPGGGPDLAGLDGEGLVERLEDLVSTQHEEGQGGELEHESGSKVAQQLTSEDHLNLIQSSSGPLLGPFPPSSDPSRKTSTVCSSPTATLPPLETVSRPYSPILAERAFLSASASGAGQGSIDNRIEQAMDLVKSHLMSAVRSEVEELRDKISKLEDTVTILSRENEVLRANVAPEVLASLTGGSRSLGLSCPPSDPASSHPALQQSNNH